MNMSEDVAGATVQLTLKAAETGSHLLEKGVDLIGRLLQILANKQREKQAKSIKSTDLTEIKPGAVSMKSLVNSCRASGDAVCTSDQSVTKQDMKFITQKAREYGIPVSFTGTKGKDSIFASIRKSDTEVFKNICTELMRGKIEERPQELGNFKVQAWEIPFITAELNQHDLSAQFGQTRDGECFCLFEKADEKAIKIARDEFVRKCGEIEKQTMLDRDENGFYTIKDIRTGKEISFDEVPSRAELSERIQSEFGYEPRKADILCAKFGQEQLQDADRTAYFSDDPQRDFSRIDANISIADENILAKPYACWRVTLKTDDTPALVFQNDAGEFCVLHPERMTAKQIRDELQKRLHIEDTATLDALTDKAQRVTDAYTAQELTKLHTEFSKEQFDMKNPDVSANMRRTDADGHVYTKSVPINSIHNTINRTDKTQFTVEVSALHIEQDEEGTDYRNTETRQLSLTLSDKKKALAELKNTYETQGVPPYIADKMARDVFAQAKEQPPERAVLVEEVREHDMTVMYDGTLAQIPLANRQDAVAEIKNAFGVPDAISEQAVSRAEQYQADAPTRTVDEARQNVEAVQSGETNFAKALNRMTDRDLVKQDNMIVCSASNPRNFIKVKGRHNKKRTVHDYEVFRDGVQQRAASIFGTNGVFTDEYSKNEAGKAQRVVLEDGTHTSYWGALKQDMLEKSGMDSDHVLVFDNESDFARYQADRAILERGIGGDKPELVNPKLPEIPVSEKLPDVPAPRSVR